MSFIAGRYSMTLGGSTVGQTADGITLNHSFFKRLITGDNFAQTPQDAIFQGAEMFVSYRLLEYNATSARAAFWPYGSAWLTMSTVIGTLDSANASQLILTALTGTPAAAASAPTSVTLPLCILAEGFETELLMAPDLREIPIRQRVYPNSSGVFGTLT